MARRRTSDLSKGLEPTAVERKILAGQEPSETPRVLTVNEHLLDDATKAAIRKRAAELVKQKRVEAAEDEYLKAAMKEAERAHSPNEQYELLMLDLAGHSDRLMIDSVVYLHGATYEFTKSEADSVREMMYRGWQHEDEIGGANRGFYERPRNISIGPKDIGKRASQLLGAR